jgi:CMP/dCMP kinase
MAVITISRQFGSGGDEIANRICEVTGYRLFDKQVIARSAAEAGLSDQEVVDYTDENYKVRGFLDRLFGRQRPIAQVRIWKENTAGIRVPEDLQLTEEHALGLVQKAIQIACKEGNFVIVGRGGQVLLKDCPEALHIRIEAPIEQRILRLRTQGVLGDLKFADSVAARRAYQDLIETRDMASAAYLSRFYGIDWADPTLYHLVVNTARLDLDLAADLIIEMARKIQPIQPIQPEKEAA